MKGFRILLLMVFLLTVGGFAACGGGGADVKSHTTTTTVGQELMDLKSAYEKGVITKEEYESTKKKILEGN